MEKISLTKELKSELSKTQNLFHFYARPLTSKLLEAMELNKNYIHGHGDYLYFEKGEKSYRVLDLTGGYGANLLGHKNPRLIEKLKSWADEGAPNLSQGSIRSKSGELAKRLSDTLKDETGEGPWITTFSNSGTEAIEAAKKHCLIGFSHKLTDLNQNIEKEINQVHLKLNSLDEKMRMITLRKLRNDLLTLTESLQMSDERKSYITHQISNLFTTDEFIGFIREINSLVLQVVPKFIALEKSYHGKTMGSLALTYSESFRTPFYLGDELNKETIFISQYIDSLSLEKILSNEKRSLIVLDIEKNEIILKEIRFSTIAGAFVEPIQGEAGIIPVSADFLALIKKYSVRENFFLVFDEIQAGLYRTGTISSGTHSHITADIYTFSKSLGGGIAKIAATTILAKKYVEEFGYLHTSTFSDDDLSSTIALEVLEILQEDNSKLTEALESADYLVTRLHWLQETFPGVIKEIRGKGLLLAVEFFDVFKEMGFEFKMICDAKMQGYAMASALLNHEGIRMNPSLSNGLTLRIAPSIHFGIMQAEEAFSGLSRLCLSMANKDITYFLSALYPDKQIHNQKTPDLKTEFVKSQRPLSVFLCHLIDDQHIRKVTKALKDLSSDDLTKKLALTKDLAEFKIYHSQTLVDKNGQEMDIIMLGVPVTSEELKKTFLSKHKYKIIEKVQAAIDYAHDLGASTVGLGQFTSIVSGNGLYLNPRGMNLTTGNAYTTALTIQAALRSAKEKNLHLEQSCAVVVGAAGNIMSVASSIISDSVGKVILIHHSPIESSLKYQEAVKRILNDIKKSESNSPIAKVIKSSWNEEKNLVDYLNQAQIQAVFEASSDVTKISQGDIVLCGASSSSSFLEISMFKQNAIIVDVAVPPSINKEVTQNLSSLRPDLTYHMGGVAKIPANKSIDFFIFPLSENESYACMAETFSLGFSGEKNILHIGDLSKEMVKRVELLADLAGFTLGNYKTKASL